MFVEKAFKAQLQLPAAAVEKAESNFVCPQCGGPAEMETFWSTSPNRPGLKILKRQIFCGKRPKRGFRNRPSSNCPVVVEEIGTEAICDSPRRLQLSIVRLDKPPASEPTCHLASRPQGPQLCEVGLGLDQVIEFLAALPIEGAQEVLELARLEHRSKLLKNNLEAKLRKKKTR